MAKKTKSKAKKEFFEYLYDRLNADFRDYMDGAVYYGKELVEFHMDSNTNSHNSHARQIRDLQEDLRNLRKDIQVLNRALQITYLVKNGVIPTLDNAYSKRLNDIEKRMKTLKNKKKD